MHTSSGEDEAIPKKRQRSPLSPNCIRYKIYNWNFGDNSDRRNGSFSERLCSAALSPRFLTILLSHH